MFWFLFHIVDKIVRECFWYLSSTRQSVFCKELTLVWHFLIEMRIGLFRYYFLYYNSAHLKYWGYLGEMSCVSQLSSHLTDAG